LLYGLDVSDFTFIVFDRLNGWRRWQSDPSGGMMSARRQSARQNLGDLVTLCRHDQLRNGAFDCIGRYAVIMSNNNQRQAADAQRQLGVCLPRGWAQMAAGRETELSQRM